MPLYEYENVAGERIEAERTIAERDNCPGGFTRVITAPARPRRGGPGLFTGRARDPGEADLAVPRAFRNIELDGTRREVIERGTGFSVQQIKRTWF